MLGPAHPLLDHSPKVGASLPCLTLPLSTTDCMDLPLQTGIPPEWGAYSDPVPHNHAPHPLGGLRRTCQCLMSRPQAVGGPPHAAGHPTVLQGKCPQEPLQVDCPCPSSWISLPWELALDPPIQQACTGALLRVFPEGNTLHMLLLSGRLLGVAPSPHPLLALRLGAEDHRPAATQVCCRVCVHCVWQLRSSNMIYCLWPWASCHRQACTRQLCQSPSHLSPAAQTDCPSSDPSSSRGTLSTMGEAATPSRPHRQTSPA